MKSRSTQGTSALYEKVSALIDQTARGDLVKLGLVEDKLADLKDPELLKFFKAFRSVYEYGQCRFSGEVPVAEVKTSLNTVSILRYFASQQERLGIFGIE